MAGTDSKPKLQVIIKIRHWSIARGKKIIFKILGKIGRVIYWAFSLLNENIKIKVGSQFILIDFIQVCSEI